MDFENTVEKLINSRRCLDYFRQLNITPTKNKPGLSQDTLLTEVEANKFANTAEYIYYFMKDKGALILWSDNANILNFSYSDLGNSTLATPVYAPPFFIILTYKQVLEFFAKGFTDKDSDANDSLIITTDNQLLYKSHNGLQRKTNIYYYYMDRRGM